MPVARRAMEEFGRWLDGVAMFSHVGFAAYDAALAVARADLAAALGDPGGASRVALQQSATAALNVVVGGLRLGRAARMVTTDQEHVSALLPTFARRERGDEVVVVPYDGDDDGFLERLAASLRSGGALLLSQVSHKNGMVLPVAEACALARERGAFAIVDGAQALGQVPVDVRAMGADAYCLLGHKWLHGPLGTGALWVREPTDGRLRPPVVGWRSLDPAPTRPPLLRRVSSGESGGGRAGAPGESTDLAGNVALKSSAERFESGTVDAAAFVGLRQALAVHRHLGAAAIAERLVALRARLLRGLAALPVAVLSRPHDPTGIVTFATTRAAVSELVDRAWREHRVVLKGILRPDEPEAVRVSFWYLHDQAAVDDLLSALAAILA